MPGTIGETWYDVGVRALEEQERHVNGLRVRTGTLVAAAAVATTLLARAVFADSHPDGPLEWLAVSIAVIGLSVVFAASVYLLRSHSLGFSLDVREAYTKAVERGIDDVERLHIELAFTMSDRQAINQPTVMAMRSAFAFALAGLVATILGLSLGAALV